MKRTRFARGGAATVLLVTGTMIGCSVLPPPSSEESSVTGARRRDHRRPAPAQGGGSATAPVSTPSPDPRKNIGGPLPGLSTTQMNRYSSGAVLMMLSWDARKRPNDESGFGPMANRNQCSACHNGGGTGGPGDSGILVNRMAVIHANSSLSAAAGFNALAGSAPGAVFNIGGPLQQFQSLQNFPRERSPEQIAVSPGVSQLDAINAFQASIGQPNMQVIHSFRQGPPAFTGLLTAIPNQQIQSYAAAQLSGDYTAFQTLLAGLGSPLDDAGFQSAISGIHGETNDLGNGKIGRLGWKGMVENNVDFVADAAVQEVGLSNPGPGGQIETRPNAPALSVTPGQEDVNQVQFDDLVFFCDTVAPAKPMVSPSDPLFLEGRTQFAKAGCIVCHAPAYTTDSSGAPPSASGKNFLFQDTNSQLTPFFQSNFGLARVPAYSDLLLHRMGPKLADGFVMGEAGGDTWKTTPLWGLGRKTGFLHDGRYNVRNSSSLEAALEAAIQEHSSPGSEANGVIQRYNDVLSAQNRQDLRSFLLRL